MSEQSGTSEQALPLPNGGGSARGLGDGFTPDLNRGSGSYSIDIDLPDGYRDLKPDLTLRYDSSTGDGPFGYGWSVPITRIQIDTDTGAGEYLDPDYLLGGKPLKQTGEDSFRHAVESEFHRIRRVDEGWEITNRRGNVTELGTSPDSRVSGTSAGEERTFAWLVESVRDTSGNEIQYEYRRDGGALYPERISYAAFSVEFQYEERPDPFTNRRPGFPITRRLRCTSIEVRRPDADHPLVRRYELHYAEGDRQPSRLERVSMEGFKQQPDGSVRRDEAPAVELGYTTFDPDERALRSIADETPLPPGALGHDGRVLVDMDGDGLPDIVQIDGGRSYVWRNEGGGEFGPQRRLSELPGSADESTILMDADGNGDVDVVSLSRGQLRYYPNGGNGQFERPRYLGHDERPLGFDPTDPETAVADVDGDGRVDLVQTSKRGLVTWENRGGENGFALPRVTPRGRNRDALPDVRLSDPNVFIADATGDGLPDVVHVVNGMVEFWPSLGGGQYDSRELVKNPPQLPQRYDPDRLFLTDVDGTGTADVVYVGPKSVRIWLNCNGDRFADPVIVSGTPYAPANSIRVVDLLGTGNTGILWSDVSHAPGNGYRYLSLTETKPYLLERIDTGTGQEIEIQYDSSPEHAARDTRKGEPWRTKLPMALPVVSRIIRRDMVTGVADTTDVFYHDGHWDPATRRFRGFGRVTTRRQAGATGSPTYEETFYHVGAPDEPEIAASSALPDEVHRARRGQVYRTVYHEGAPGGTPIRVEETDWQVTVEERSVDGTPILFPHVATTVVQNYEGDDHPRVTTTSFEYDEFGNVTKQEKRGHAPDGDDNGNRVEPITVTTKTEYAVDRERHVVDRPARVVQRDANGDVLGEVRHYYDGAAFEGLPLGEVDEGLLTRQEELVLGVDRAAGLYGQHEPDWTELGYHRTTRADGQETWAVDQTRFDHTARGMVTRKRDPLGNETVYEYGEDDLLVDRTVKPEGHEETAVWDRSWQLLDEQEDVAGSSTSYTYDGQGRLRSVVRPGDTLDMPTLSYEYQDSQFPRGKHVRKRRRSGETDVYERAVYRDGAGNQIQERTRVDEQRVRVSGPVQFDQRGEPIAKGDPSYRSRLEYESPDPIAPGEGIRFEYDSIGRLVSVTRPDGDDYEVEYTPWTATHRGRRDEEDGDADGPRIEHFDALGRLTGISRVDEDGMEHRATYNHDLLGRLVSSMDAAGRPAVEHIEYDASGNKLRIEHATAGVRTAVYDARGKVVRFWDDRNRIVERSFDDLGRLVSIEVEDTVVERYHYDETPQGPGRLVRVEDDAGTVTFGYDRRGRITEKEREIDGEHYTISYDYDAAGEIEQLTYPNGASATFDRWGDTRVRSVTGLVDELEYDGQGRLQRVSHANDVVEDLTYNDAGVIESIEAARNGQSLFQQGLTHDAAGMIDQIETTVPGGGTRTERYQYDAQGFLTEAKHQHDNGGEVWGYDYDAAGNLRQADEMNVDRYEYDFDEPGALTGLTPEGASAENVSFDDAGHATDLEGMSLNYDARGRLEEVTTADGKTVEMTYDYRGARVLKRVSDADGTRETRYVDELYEETGNVGTAYVMAAGRLLGYFRDGGQRHLHTNHRGTPVLVTKPDGSVDGRNWFSPYGAAAERSGATPSRSYTGAVYDSEVELFYMNQRYYAPRLGRFLSPDGKYLGQPGQNQEAPITQNLYAYAGANPVEHVDPTGQQFWENALETTGEVLGAVVSGAAYLAAAALTGALLVVSAPFAAIGAGIGAIAGGISSGWEGAAMGAMMGATMGINIAIAGPVIGGALAIVQGIGIVGGDRVREQNWYQSLAGWSSWFAPASWPGHLMGLGAFLANGIAHVFGSSRQIQTVEFDWQHGQIQTVGGNYGVSPFPWLPPVNNAPAHNLGGFSFFENQAEFNEDSPRFSTREHETGHMLNNFTFGFWQGVINGIEAPQRHQDRFFEQIAESNVNAADRAAWGNTIAFWHD